MQERGVSTTKKKNKNKLIFMICVNNMIWQFHFKALWNQTFKIYAISDFS